MSKKVKGQLRQGDIMITPYVGEIPEDAKEIPRDGGRAILAYGEVTGHAHAISSPDATLYQLGADSMLLVAQKEVTLNHETHGPIKLPAGMHQVTRQVEWDFGVSRQVAD